MLREVTSGGASGGALSRPKGPGKPAPARGAKEASPPSAMAIDKFKCRIRILN